MREVLMQDDTVIDFEIGANRADCLSVQGVAREASAAVRAPFHLPELLFQEAGGDVSDYVRVQVDAPELCPRYMARVIRNVKMGPSTAVDAAAFACGRRTAYQQYCRHYQLRYAGDGPAHACRSTLRIYAVAAYLYAGQREGESMHTLDGKLRTFTGNNLLICDAAGPIGIAGVMGGENSQIKETTKTIVCLKARKIYVCQYTPDLPRAWAYDRGFHALRERH